MLIQTAVDPMTAHDSEIDIPLPGFGGGIFCFFGPENRKSFFSQVPAEI
jgi:hypothetical protein